MWVNTSDIYPTFHGILEVLTAPCMPPPTPHSPFPYCSLRPGWNPISSLKHSLATAFCTDPLSLTNNSSHYLWDAFWHLQFIKHFQNLYISSVANDFIFWTLGQELRGIAGLDNRVYQKSGRDGSLESGPLDF